MSVELFLDVQVFHVFVVVFFVLLFFAFSVIVVNIDVDAVEEWFVLFVVV